MFLFLLFVVFYIDSWIVRVGLFGVCCTSVLLFLCGGLFVGVGWGFYLFWCCTLFCCFRWVCGLAGVFDWVCLIACVVRCGVVFLFLL